MKFVVQHLLKPLLSVFLSTILLISSFIVQAPVFANGPGLSPPISDLAKTFSKKYCAATSDGISSEAAAKVAAGEMIGGLIFSGDLQKLKSIPQQDMVSSLVLMIIDSCGEEIEISEQELYEQMDALASVGLGGPRSKSFDPVT
ncbi:MAG: hypothetical protein AB8B36_05985 [Prochlorococcus sp.]